MFGMSPETLVDREVGNEISINSEIRIPLNRNITYLDDLLDQGEHGDSSTIVDIDLTKQFDIETINYIETLTRVEVINIVESAKNIDKYYSSGHPNIYGINNVLDNIDNFIDMSTDLSWARDKNVTVAGNGSTYDKSTEGVIPQSMTMLFNYRKSLKNEMKEAKKKLQVKIKELHELESKLKQLEN